MTCLSFGLTGVGLLLSLTLSAQQLNVGPTPPVAGKTLELRYNPAGGPLKGNDPVQGEVLTYQHYHWTKTPVALTRQSGGWAGRYAVPADGAFVAFRFYQGEGHLADQLDGQVRYGYKTSTAAGKPLPGGELAQVIFQMPTLDQTMPAYWSDVPKPLPAAVLTQTLQTELSSPAQIRQAAPTYLAMQRAALGTSFKQQAPALLAKLDQLPDLPETALMDMARIYRYELKDSTHANQLETRMIRQNPQGTAARLMAFQRATSGTKVGETIPRLTAFLTQFPYASWRAKPNQQAFIYYTVHYSLAAAYFDSRQFAPFVAMLPPLDFKTTNEIARWNVLRAYTFKTVSPDSILIVSTPLIDNLIAKKGDGSFTEAGVFTPEKAREQAITQLDDRLYTHISLLHDLGKNQDAIRYYAQLSPKGRYANAEFNETYLSVLEQTGAATQPFLEACARANALTPATLDKLRAGYTQKNNADGFDKYLASLKGGSGATNEIQAYVKEHLMNHELMPFALENPQGELVRSSDWEGKIVVLDFWATWCKPCIAAFPGMQLLVDRYAADSTVAVYFVGTQQSGDYKQKSEGYIKQKGYRFNLLHDGINKKTGEQDAVFSTLAPIFHSSGIPRKIVLKDGVMRYSSEGYSGSPSKLVDELSAVIDLLKAEK